MANDNREFLTRHKPVGSGDSDSMSGADRELSGRLLNLVRDERRLALLRCLVASSEHVLGREELARRVAAEEADGGPSQPVERRVVISLHHKHLPALDAEGLVDYDERTGKVVFDPDDATERALLELLE